MEITDLELIKALRCSASVHTEKVDCKGCPFFLKEEVPEDMRDMFPEDFFSSCDCDAMMLAAANRMEELTKRMEEKNNG